MDNQILISRLNDISDGKGDVHRLISDLSKEEDIEHIKAIMPDNAKYFGLNDSKDMIFDFPFSSSNSLMLGSDIIRQLYAIDLVVAAISVQEDDSFEFNKRIRVWISKKDALVT